MSSNGVVGAGFHLRQQARRVNDSVRLSPSTAYSVTRYGASGGRERHGPVFFIGASLNLSMVVLLVLLGKEEEPRVVMVTRQGSPR